MIYKDTTAINAVNKGISAPDGFYEPKHPSVLMATSEYIHTDGLRGYTSVKSQNGFKVIKEDWLTGDWSDAPIGHSEFSVDELLQKLEKEYETIYVIFTPTSNVFSTCYTVLIKDEDVKINKGVRLANNTRKFIESDGSYTIRLHATDIITYDAKTNIYTLNSGGWDTMTTRARINEFLPCNIGIHRIKGVTYIRTPDKEIVFEDGIQIRQGMQIV